MIFAEIRYQKHYDEMHKELVDFIEARFANVESGHQGDSWIWVLEEGDKVEIDTFSAMTHQVKSRFKDSKLVHEVIRELNDNYSLVIYPKPELEAHDDQ